MFSGIDVLLVLCVHALRHICTRSSPAMIAAAVLSPRTGIKRRLPLPGDGTRSQPPLERGGRRGGGLRLSRLAVLVSVAS